MVLRLISLFSALLFSTQAFGEITLLIPGATSLATASRMTGRILGDQLANSSIIYGGLGGQLTNGTCATATGTTTCNSCNPATDEVCNGTRIYENLLLQLTFVTNQPGRVLVTSDADAGNSPVSIPFELADPNFFYQANTTITVGIRWGDICDLLFDSTAPGCSDIVTATTKNIRIGIDTPSPADITGTSDLALSSGEFATGLQIRVVPASGNNTESVCQSAAPFAGSSVCNFIAYPGDKKVFIEDVRAPASFSIGSSNSQKFLRVFYAPNGTGLNGTSPYVDMPFDSVSSNDGSTNLLSLAENEVTGLTRGVQYNFKTAIVDEARNISSFLDVQLVDSDSDTIGDQLDINSNVNCYDVNAPEQGNPTTFNCHAAIPEDVIALMQEEWDCWITTATYGSPYRPKVKAFRSFREKYLKTNALGRWIVQKYKETSPPIAAWIHNNPWSKKYVRVALWPLWAFAFVALEHPAWLLLCLVLATLFVFRKKVIR